MTTQLALVSEQPVPAPECYLQAFNPDRGLTSLKLSAARKALNGFKKACADPIAVIDLMLFYVEQGVVCTNTYGDIDGPFYDSLISVYEAAARLVSELKLPNSWTRSSPVSRRSYA